MSLECYSQRLLNPFRGVMHIIRYASAEAVTLDGAHWDIYVSDDTLLAGLRVNRWTQITDIRYGSWSLEKGLKRGPLYPSDDFKRMEEMGAPGVRAAHARASPSAVRAQRSLRTVVARHVAPAPGFADQCAG